MVTEALKNTVAIRRQIVVVAALLLISLAPADANGIPQSPNTAHQIPSELHQAKQVAATLKADLLKKSRLAERGSISKHALRVAEFKYKSAELDVVTIEYPQSKERIELSRAKLALDFRSREFDSLAKLYRRGSVSEVAYRKALTARDIAELNYAVARHGNADKLHPVRVAYAKLALARDYHERALRLYNVGALTQPAFDRVRRNLAMAEEEWRLAKKNLGIRVTQVPVVDQQP